MKASVKVSVNSQGEGPGGGACGMLGGLDIVFRRGGFFLGERRWMKESWRLLPEI